MTSPPSYIDAAGNGSSVGLKTGGGEYATVRTGSQCGRGTSPSEVGVSGVPIYSNATITKLASDVELHGADAANQTDV